MELLARAMAGPAYPADAGDRSDIRILGLDLPVRSTIALLVVTVVVLLDYSRTLIPADLRQLAQSADGARAVGIEELTLYGLVPLAIVAFGFRDRPARYGVQLGEWRWGLGLLLAGLAIMTPIILLLAQLPDFARFYGAPAGTLGETLVSYLLQLLPAEFVFRGFLLFVLLRRIGPLALVVVQVPFIFSHIGKPELELWSTFIGGSVFAWLDWRTGSVLWSALGHVYVLTLMIVAVGAIR